MLYKRKIAAVSPSCLFWGHSGPNSKTMKKHQKSRRLRFAAFGSVVLRLCLIFVPFGASLRVCRT